MLEETQKKEQDEKHLEKLTIKELREVAAEILHPRNRRRPMQRAQSQRHRMQGVVTGRRRRSFHEHRRHGAEVRKRRHHRRREAALCRPPRGVDLSRHRSARVVVEVRQLEREQPRGGTYAVHPRRRSRVDARKLAQRERRRRRRPAKPLDERAEPSFERGAGHYPRGPGGPAYP